jgi:PAS domain S-box-containing protein
MQITHDQNENLQTILPEQQARGELYRTLAHNFPNGAVLLFDCDLRYTLAEGVGLSEVGLSREFVEGKTIWEIFSPDVSALLEPRFRDALAGQASTFEVAFAGRVYQVHALPIFDSRGEISTGMVMTQDITDRKQIEDNLRRSQQRYEQLVNSIEGIVWEGNAQTFEYYFVSQQAERLLGYPIARWTGEPTFWSDHIHPEDRDWAVNFCALATSQKRDHVFEYRMIAADGRVVWLRDIVTVVLENGLPATLRGVMVDITESKRIEAELREREEQYRSIFNSVTDALAIVDLEDGRIVDFNPAAHLMHGYTAEEYRRLRPSDIIHPDSYQVFKHLIEKLRAGQEFRAYGKGVRKDGTAYDTYTIAIPFTYRGKPHALAVSRDVTEQVAAQKLMGQRVEERTRQLQTLLEVSRTVASTLDLKTLLGLVLDQLRAVVAFTSAAILTVENGVLVIRAERGPFTREQLSQAWFSLDNPVDHTIIHHQKPLVIPDIYADTPMAQAFRLAAGEHMSMFAGFIRSWMGVPLIVKGQVTGMIALDHTDPDQYSDTHANLVMTFANHVAVAIENARLFHTVQRGADRIRAISEMGQRITSILDVNELLSQTVHLIRDTFGYYHIHIGLVEGDRLVFPAAAGVYEDEPVCSDCASLHLHLGQETICGLVAGTGEPLLIPDIAKEPRYLHPKEATGSGIVVPLKFKGQVIGLIDVETRQVNAFDESDVAVLQLFADQVAVAIENARLYEKARELAALQERQKLARELHDSVSQALYGIGLGARTARSVLDREDFRKESLAPPLDYVLSLANSGLAEMRALIFELRPESLQNEGLVAALGKQAAALEARHQLPVELALGEEPELSLEAKETLYRIAQEAAHNVVKHAKAGRIVLRLHAVEGYVQLEIQDDGIGFDAQGNFPGHLGLQSMRERAERLGGTVTIASALGKGTQICAKVPQTRS